MGAINFNRIGLVTAVSETVGYKSGLGLNRVELLDLSDPAYHEYLGGDDQDWVRIRSEEYEDLLHSVLYAVGNIPRRHVMMPGIRQWHESRGDAEKEALVMGVWGLMPEYLEAALDNTVASGSKTLDPRPFVEAAERGYGTAGALLALELLDDLDLMQHATPWSGRTSPSSKPSSTTNR